MPLAQLRQWGRCPTWPAAAFSPTAPLGALGAAVEAAPCAIFVEARCGPQSVALTTLVAMEMLKALSAVSVDASLLAVRPWQNKALLLGVAGPSLLHLAVLYTPGLGAVFGLGALTKADWASVARHALPVLLVEEVLKGIGRWRMRGEDRAGDGEV